MLWLQAYIAGVPDKTNPTLPRPHENEGMVMYENPILAGGPRGSLASPYSICGLQQLASAWLLYTFSPFGRASGRSKAFPRTRWLGQTQKH